MSLCELFDSYIFELWYRFRALGVDHTAFHEMADLRWSRKVTTRLRARFFDEEIARASRSSAEFRRRSSPQLGFSIETRPHSSKRTCLCSGTKSVVC